MFLWITSFHLIVKPLNEHKYSKSMRNISYGDSATLPRGFKGRIHANIPPLSLGSGGEENPCYTGTIVLLKLLKERNIRLMVCQVSPIPL